MSDALAASVSLSGPPSLRAAGQTHRGLVRRENQDRFAVVPCAGERGLLLVVADGMGGPAGGGEASRVAMECFVSWIEDRVHPDARPDEVAKLLLQAVLAANGAVRERARETPNLRGMGTTLTAALTWGTTLHHVQVGDSRAYLLRGGTLVQVTRDQSMVQRMLDAGVLNEAEARQSPHRNVLLQALGVEDGLEPVAGREELRPGDRILICSDGLSGTVEADEIARILGERGAPEARCDALVRAALAAGAPDNVTSVVAEFGDGDGDGLSPPRPAPEPAPRP